MSTAFPANVCIYTRRLLCKGRSVSCLPPYPRWMMPPCDIRRRCQRYAKHRCKEWWVTLLTSILAHMLLGGLGWCRPRGRVGAALIAELARVDCFLGGIGLRLAACPRAVAAAVSIQCLWVCMAGVPYSAPRGGTLRIVTGHTRWWWGYGAWAPSGGARSSTLQTSSPPACPTTSCW